MKRHPTAGNTIRELPGLPARATRAIAYPDLRLLAHAIGWAGIGLAAGLLLGGALIINTGVCT